MTPHGTLMTGTDPGRTPAVRMTGIVRRFGAVEANRNASIEVAMGEIHALVGENGAGKSTLMSILSGLLHPDAGRVEVNGRDVTGWSTAQAIASGVGMVHQHFLLVPTLTVAENIVLGREPARAGLYDHDQAVRIVAGLAERTGLAVHPGRLVADLPVSEAQRVEILKTLHRGTRILLLDEPTAVLSPVEVAGLWTVLRRLREAGTTIVLITHKLDEVMSIAERVTVMRQGAAVTTLVTRETTPDALAMAMVGREVDLPHGDEQRAPARGDGMGSAAREPGLEVRGLTVSGAHAGRAVADVSFSVARGEILGIAGIEGNGQSELLEAIAGLRPSLGGTVRVGDRDVTRASVRERADAGLSHIPEDRHRRGLILDCSVAENLILGQQHRFVRGVALDREAIATHASHQLATFAIRPADPSLPARALSGGNQQKVVAARALSRDFVALLAAQPTRGMDVGAIESIHTALRHARAAGKAILLVSADLREVLSLADRIAVMYGGRFVAMLARAEATEELLGRHMTGAPGASAA